MIKFLDHQIVAKEFLSFFLETANENIQSVLESGKYTSYISLTFKGDVYPYEHIYIDITDSNIIQLRIKQPCDGFRCVQGLGKTERGIANYLIGTYHKYKRKQLEDLKIKLNKLEGILEVK